MKYLILVLFFFSCTEIPEVYISLNDVTDYDLENMVIKKIVSKNYVLVNDSYGKLYLKLVGDRVHNVENIQIYDSLKNYVSYKNSNYLDKAAREKIMLLEVRKKHR